MADFSDDKINLQWIRDPLIPFSMALIADYLRYVQIEMMNSYKINQVPHLDDWAKRSRLNRTALIATHFDPTDEHHRALIARIKTATMDALPNLPKVAGNP